jgi:hypothetical protein
MTASTDTFALEEIITRNAIDTRWFLPFTIYRLQPFAVDRAVIFDVTLQNVLPEPLAIRQLQLTWAKSSERLHTPPVQEHVVTEWAACGIACALLPLYTGLQVLQVTQVGDRFDYWVGNETQEFGLEISGLLTGDLEQRHRTKIRQFIESPHKVAGYVSVTNFQSQHSLLSFHRS